MKSDAKTGTLKFLCSYGGKIRPRHTDGKLRYAGGLTRVLAVDRCISYCELMVKLVEFCGSSLTLKCQLPGGDLETLISVKSDEDLANIVEEYDRASSYSLHPLQIRSVLSPPKSLKQVSPPSSQNSTLPNSPCYGVDSPPNSMQHGINDRIYSPPPYRFIRRTSSPPPPPPPQSKYFVGPRNCHGRTCCHGSPRFLYPGIHSAYRN